MSSTNEVKKPFKMPSTFPAMLLVLLVICLLCSVLLALTYALTKDSITAVELDKTRQALARVLPGFDNDPLRESAAAAEDPGIMLYPLRKGSDFLGHAVSSYSTRGYSGYVGVMVGIDATGRITGLQVLKANETPGLGTNMANPDFQAQFIGQSLPAGGAFQVKKDGGSIDALSAATISSRAFCDAVNRAMQAVKQEAR